MSLHDSPFVSVTVAMVNAATRSAVFLDALECYRERVMEHLRAIIPKNRYSGILYDLMLEYPLREGKGFRPAFCLSVCQACGGRLEDALNTATALELFHNAFLIHDDIEDGSENRRKHPTLHSKYGIAVATNVGDALNILAMGTLLRNLETVGLEKSLAVIREVERMARETTEGQAMELEWVRSGTPKLSVRDYFWMTRKKTCWYTCIAPLRTGALIAGIHDQRLDMLVRFGFEVGVAFQIQDDVLNLVADEALYGKEIGGDIWEGKRTLMFVHLINQCGAAALRRVLRIYNTPRGQKREEDIRYLYALIEAHGSIAFAKEIAFKLAMRAKEYFEDRLRWIPESVHRQFIGDMIAYMIEREL